MHVLSIQACAFKRVLYMQFFFLQQANVHVLMCFPTSLREKYFARRR